MAAMPDLSKAEKNRLMLSYQTLEGLKITSISFVALVRDLVSEGATCILPEKLNQDKLEILFSKVRCSLGDIDNPTVYDVGYRLLHLLIAGSHIIKPRNTNCDGGPDEHEFQLHQRKRRR